MALVHQLSTLNAVTKNDHYPLPFVDQMIARMSCCAYYYFSRWIFRVFLDCDRARGSGENYFHVPVGTFIYRRMPFGLWMLLPLFRGLW